MDAKQSGQSPEAILIDTTRLVQADQIKRIVDLAIEARR